MAKKKSDFSRAFSEDGARKTHVGGQALIEGVMMRGKFNWSVAVREPEGTIYTEEHDLASGRKKNGWMSLPLIRGCVAMVESLVLGYKALEIAALHAFGDEDEEGEEGKPAAEAAEAAIAEAAGKPGVRAVSSVEGEAVATNPLEPLPETATEGAVVFEGVAVPASAESVAAQGEAAVSSDKEEKKPFMEEEVEFGKKEMAVSMVFGIALGVALFIALPAFLTNLLVGEYDNNTVLWNVVDGFLRVGVFVFYMWLIGRMKDVKRMFGYHGAEHKTIHCYEHGLELTPENARSFPRLHVRCGTAFLIMVMIIAILVYTIVPINPLIGAWGVPDGAPKLLLVIAVRILFMPVIAGLSYEISVRWAGKHPENPLVKVILWPGMQMQYLTTNEPDDGQIECAIEAMKMVLVREELEQRQQEQSGEAVQAAGKGCCSSQ